MSGRTQGIIMVPMVNESEATVISKMNSGSHSTAFLSPLGWFGLRMSDSGVETLHFGYATKNKVLEQLGTLQVSDIADLPVWWLEAQNLLIAYANGESVDLSQIPVDATRRTPFQDRVVQNLQRIGYGQTISYGELAKRAGSPGAARAVGNQMAKNRVPLLIPCHRVIASGGRLGGFSAPDGVSMKVRLLKMEQADCNQFRSNEAVTI